MRLEIRTEVSAIDESTSDINGNPGFKVRRTDTGQELQAGQTLAIAGLLQTLSEAERRGIPWVSDLPYLGAAFRRVEQRENEIELLVLVTPELVEGMDPEQVPRCLPGMDTKLPGEWDMFIRGYLEVPNCCTICNGNGCPACDGMNQCNGPIPDNYPGMLGMSTDTVDRNPRLLHLEEVDPSITRTVQPPETVSAGGTEWALAKFPTADSQSSYGNIAPGYSNAVRGPMGSQASPVLNNHNRPAAPIPTAPIPSGMAPAPTAPAPPIQPQRFTNPAPVPPAMTTNLHTTIPARSSHPEYQPEESRNWNQPTQTAPAPAAPMSTDPTRSNLRATYGQFTSVP